MSTTQYVDLVAHEKLMEMMQSVIDKANALLDASGSSADLISQHNVDTSAHPDLRELIEEVTNSSSSSSAVTEAVSSAIDEHNSSSSAHADLFNNIQTQITNVESTLQEQINNMSSSSAVSEAISNAVDEHNSSSSAHADIRQAIAQLETRISESVDVNEAIDDLEEKITDLIDETIVDLQSTDALLQNEIEIQAGRIDALESDVSQHERDILYLGNNGALHDEETARYHLETICLKVEHEYGYERYLESGPSLLNFNCTLPVYVGRDATTSFSIYGAEGDSISYTIETGKGNLSFNTTSGISDYDTVEVTVDSDETMGDYCYFFVTATDSSGQSVKRAVAFFVTQTINTDNVTLADFPSTVEPGNRYTFNVRNLVEPGHRYTYSLDSLTSGLIFSKTSEIEELDTITMTVPSGAVRGTDLTFNLIIHDIYDGDVIKTISVGVNRLPELSNFTHTVPSVIAPGSTVIVKFYGVTSANGYGVTYDITSYDDTNITFSKTEDILTNENITLTLSETATRGDTLTFTLTTSDENDVHLEITISFKVNELPDDSDVTIDFVETTPGGVTYPLTIYGGSDPEDGTNITYTVRDGGAGMVFARYSSISPGTPVNVTIPKVADTTTATFTIYVVDSLGEMSSGRTFSVTVEPVYIADTPTITYPTAGLEVDAEFTATVSAYNAVVDI